MPWTELFGVVIGGFVFVAGTVGEGVGLCDHPRRRVMLVSLPPLRKVARLGKNLISIASWSYFATSGIICVVEF